MKDSWADGEKKEEGGGEGLKKNQIGVILKNKIVDEKWKARWREWIH